CEATTVSGDHAVPAGGLGPLGPSKDDPTRPPSKVMRGALAPWGPALSPCTLGLCSMVSSCEQSPWACVEVTPLLLDTVFAPCARERPPGVMARAGLARLLAAPRREALWARTAQPPDTRALLFASLGPLMREGVLGVPPLGRGHLEVRRP